MISETQKRPNKWHGFMTEEWMVVFARKKLKEKEEAIVKFQTETPKIYYIGVIFGATGTVYGIFTANLIYSGVGLGVAITAIIGIWEAKTNAR